MFALHRAVTDGEVVLGDDKSSRMPESASCPGKKRHGQMEAAGIGGGGCLDVEDIRAESFDFIDDVGQSPGTPGIDTGVKFEIVFQAPVDVRVVAGQKLNVPGLGTRHLLGNSIGVERTSTTHVGVDTGKNDDSIHELPSRYCGAE